MEKEKSYNLARENFNKVLELSESHPLALEGLKRIGVNYQRSDVIELSDDEEQQQTRNGTGEKQRRVSESIEDVEKNRKRLREMEVFIENLKKSK